MIYFEFNYDEEKKSVVLAGSFDTDFLIMFSKLCADLGFDSSTTSFEDDNTLLFYKSICPERLNEKTPKGDAKV